MRQLGGVGGVFGRVTVVIANHPLLLPVLGVSTATARWPDGADGDVVGEAIDDVRRIAGVVT